MPKTEKNDDKLPGQEALEQQESTPAISPTFLRTRLTFNRAKKAVYDSAEDLDETATDVLKVGTGLVLVFTGSGVALPIMRLALWGGGGKLVTKSFRWLANKRKTKLNKRIQLMEDFAEYKKNRQAAEEAAPSMASA